MWVFPPRRKNSLRASVFPDYKGPVQCEHLLDISMKAVSESCGRQERLTSLGDWTAQSSLCREIWKPPPRQNFLGHKFFLLSLRLLSYSKKP